MGNKLLCALLVGMCLVMINVSQAAEVALENADFSLPAIGVHGYNDHGSLAATWGDKPGEVVMGNQYKPQPEIVAYYNGGGDGPKGGVWQITEELISINTAYTFSIRAALRDGGSCKLFLYAVDESDNWTLFAEQEVLQADIPGSNPNAYDPISVTGSLDVSQIEFVGQKLAVGTQAFDNAGQFFVDKAKAEKGSLPGAAWDPDPADGEQDVVEETILKWKTGLDPNELEITGHHLYIGTDMLEVTLATSDDHPGVDFNNLPVTSDPNNQSFDPDPDLLDSTVYYWRVDERLDNSNTIAGSVWNFETVSYAVTNSIPEDGATEVNPVDPDLALEWTPGFGGPYKFNIYGGTDPEALQELSHEQSETSLVLQPITGPLEWSTTYYWVVDQVVQDGTGRIIPGNAFTFTTIVPVCDPPLLADADGDCSVTYADLAVMAAEWLSCNWIPAEACQ